MTKLTFMVLPRPKPQPPNPEMDLWLTQCHTACCAGHSDQFMPKDNGNRLYIVYDDFRGKVWMNYLILKHKLKRWGWAILCFIGRSLD